MPAPRQPLRLGILGCANIARQFVTHVAPSTAVRVAAVASRDASKAAAFAAGFGIARHHASYEALLDDEGVDAVYIPLPNSLHAPWAIAAARCGKHVLCEKPLALGAAEARAMFAAARASGVFLLESYPWWFQPQTAALIDLLRDVGEVRTMQATFTFTMSNPTGNIRMNPELGGGALLDAGSYPVSLVRLAMSEAPQRVQASSTWAPPLAGHQRAASAQGPSGVDLATAATLHFHGGRTAQIACAMNAAMVRHALIVGERGVIETDFHNHTGSGPHGTFLPSRLRVRRGTQATIAFEDVTSPTGSGFRFAAEAFAKVVAERDAAAIERAATASIDIAATLEAIARSARQGTPVDV
jgi:predicted dehydrogenase